MDKKIPKLFFNTSKEDKQAVELVMKSGIPYIGLGPTTEEQTPYIEYGQWKFYGLKGISGFITRWKQNNRPPS